MCKTPKQCGYAILAAILGSVFALLFVSALVQQFVNRGTLAGDMETTRLLGQYFVALLFAGAAKHCKWKACEDAPAKKKK